MIIKENKIYEVNPLFPGADWYSEGNYIIDETAEQGKQMAQLYIDNYPFVDYEQDGEFVTKVIVLDKPEKPEEVEGKRIELQQDEQGEWGYIYIDIAKTETEIQQEIINTLGQELAQLKLQFMIGGM